MQELEFFVVKGVKRPFRTLRSTPNIDPGYSLEPRLLLVPSCLPIDTERSAKSTKYIY